MDILQVADAVAREKGISRDEVVAAMEEAIQKAARSKYGHESEVRAKVDRSTGEIKLTRYRIIVADDEVIENESVQLTVSGAARIKPDAKVGDEIMFGKYSGTEVSIDDKKYLVVKFEDILIVK